MRGNRKLYDLLLGESRNASHVYRYSSKPVLRRENVAEHSYYVMFYSLWIAEQLYSAGGFDFNHSQLLMRGLLHDIDECLTGDFIRPFKYHNQNLTKEISSAAESLAKDLFVNMGLPTHLEFWQNAKDDSPEGQVLAFADMICVIAYLLEELRSGNFHAHKIMEEAHSHYAALKENVAFKRFGEELRQAVLIEYNLRGIRYEDSPWMMPVV